MARRLRRILPLPVDEDVRRELELHVELRAEELEEQGWSPAEARHEALRLFGDYELIASDCRNVTTRHRRSRRLSDMFDALRQDLVFGFRALRRSPTFTAVALLTLALGIGATSAIFTVVDAVLFEPLPYEQPERLAALWELSENGRDMRIPHRNFVDWRERTRAFDSMAIYSGFGGTTTAEVPGRAPVRVRVSPVSVDFFRVMGSPAKLGRTFSTEESRLGAAPTVVVSHRFWSRHLGHTPSLDGAVIDFRGDTYQVIGVLPASFNFPAGVDLFYPSELSVPTEARTAHNWNVVGRLKPGVSLERAEQELDAVAKDLKATFGDETDAVGARVRDLREELVGDHRQSLLVLLVAAGMVLLVAASNLASTLLARSVERQREIAIRSAIGAGRLRVVRQLLTETLLLTLLGGLAGLGVAWAVLKVLLTLRPSGLPRLDEISLDGEVWLFTLGVSVLTGLLFGLFPVLRLRRVDLRESLSEGARHGGGPHRGRAWDLLVAGEVALALTLLVGAGLSVRSFHNLTTIDPGFDAGEVVTLQLTVPDLEFPAGFDVEALLPVEKEIATFFAAFLQDLQGMPGVESFGVINELPLSGSDSHGAVLLDGWDVKDYRSASYRVVAGDYFDALDIPIVRGRAFDQREVDGPQSVIINEAFARSFFPDQDPLSQRVQSYGMDIHYDEKMTVVGVVGDVLHRGLRGEPTPEIYVPMDQRAIRASTATLVLEGSVDAAQIVPVLKQRLQQTHPTLPLQIKTMGSVVDKQLDRDRFSLLLIGAFATLALILAALGIYGVVAYSVARRTRELGIRIALGAAPKAVIRQLMVDVLRVVCLGAAVGWVGSYFLGKGLENRLHGVGSMDPMALVTMSLVLILAAAIACWIPARRTASIDPISAMREG